jgi:mRNA interferase MazF
VSAVWDVVRVPFPYADRTARSFRPALVVAAPEAGDAPPVVWVLMITAAENPPWPGDVLVAPKPGNGLPIPSRIRLSKVATVDATQVERIGRLSAAERAKVAAGLRGVLDAALA